MLKLKAAGGGHGRMSPRAGGVKASLPPPHRLERGRQETPGAVGRGRKGKRGQELKSKRVRKEKVRRCLQGIPCGCEPLKPRDPR